MSDTVEGGGQVVVQDSDGGSTPTEGASTPEPQNGPLDLKPNREARYRVERNEARAERDALAERVAQLQTREVERQAAQSLSVPADIFTLSGKSLADLLDDNGDVDPELVSEVVQDILGTRPGLRPSQPATDVTQGLGGGPVKPQISWGDLLKS